MDVESQVAITLPPGYAEGVVEPMHVDSPFAQFSVKSTPAVGLVRLECRVHRPSGSYPAVQYSACQESLGRVMGAFEQNLVFK